MNRILMLLLSNVCTFFFFNKILATEINLSLFLIKLKLKFTLSVLYLNILYLDSSKKKSVNESSFVKFIIPL